MSSKLDKNLADSVKNYSVGHSTRNSSNRGVADAPLLASYDQKDLYDRAIAQLQTLEAQRAALIASGRKAIADSLRDTFQLTGSDLPADADPRQLHLF